MDSSPLNYLQPWLEPVAGLFVYSYGSVFDLMHICIFSINGLILCHGCLCRFAVFYMHKVFLFNISLVKSHSRENIYIQTRLQLSLFADILFCLCVKYPTGLASGSCRCLAGRGKGFE